MNHLFIRVKFSNIFSTQTQIKFLLKYDKFTALNRERLSRQKEKTINYHEQSGFP